MSGRARFGGVPAILAPTDEARMAGTRPAMTERAGRAITGFKESGGNKAPQTGFSQATVTRKPDLVCGQ